MAFHFYFFNYCCCCFLLGVTTIPLKIKAFQPLHHNLFISLNQQQQKHQQSQQQQQQLSLSFCSTTTTNQESLYNNSSNVIDRNNNNNIHNNNKNNNVYPFQSSLSASSSSRIKIQQQQQQNVEGNDDKRIYSTFLFPDSTTTTYTTTTAKSSRLGGSTHTAIPRTALKLFTQSDTMFVSDNDGIRQQNQQEQGNFSNWNTTIIPSMQQQVRIPTKVKIDDNHHHTNVQEKKNDESVNDVHRRRVLLSMLTVAAGVSNWNDEAWAAAMSSSTQQQKQQPDSIQNTAAYKRNMFYDIIIPPLDDRQYVAYTLENGLRVLLCSDPKGMNGNGNNNNEIAVAMDVHVGACSDPVLVPGLAHFNEHMLFLGTKQYPKEDSFSAFLATNGGSSNAYTDSENTVYYYDMVSDNDRTVLDGFQRFGSFFSDPLFTESATARELNAIESEHSKNIQSDLFRTFQIDKARMNQNHPYSKFFTGNKQTLLENTKQLNINLRQELIQFYNQYYSANQMTLAIVAPQSLETLQQMVETAFGSIPNKNVEKPEVLWTGITPCTSIDNSIIPSYNHIVEIVPVKDLRQMNIKWPIVYQSESDKLSSLYTKPSTYVAHLLGHEGTNSLLSYLKNEKGYVNSISASTNEELSDFETFEVVVGLTTQGLQVVEQIIEYIYSYIKMLQTKSIPDYIYKEVLQLEELQWRFLTKGSPRNYVTSLATSMQKFTPQYYVAGPRRLALDYYDNMNTLTEPTTLARYARTSFTSPQQFQQTENAVQNYIKQLTVDNGIITVLSQTFASTNSAMTSSGGGGNNQKEKWYGTEYRVRPIPNDILEQWRTCPPANQIRGGANKLSPKSITTIDYPKPNCFIPTESGLKVKFPLSKNNNINTMIPTTNRDDFEQRLSESITPPRIIRDDYGSTTSTTTTATTTGTTRKSNNNKNGKWTVYFKEDETFGKPYGYVIFEVLTKDVFASPMNAALANLYELSVSDKLREYAYDAGLAGLTYDVRVLPRGVRLTFGGYNDKLKQFAAFVSRKVSQEVLDLLPRNDNEFSRFKDQIMRSLTAFDVNQPYAHASYYAQITLQPRRFQYSNKELREATRKTTLPDLVDYAKTLWSSGKGEALIQGNFNEMEALDLVRNIGDVLPFQPIPENDVPARLQALPLPQTNALTIPPRLLIAEPNPANENSVSYVMLQSLVRTEKDHVLVELLNSIVEEPFYNELRTKKQLGYIVASGVKAIENTRTLSFIVQSNVAAADALTIEILSFLDRVESSLLAKVSKIDFAVYVKSLFDKKLEPDKDLGTEVTRNWNEIASGRYQFNRRQLEAQALLDLEKSDLIDFWRTLYASNGRRMLVTEIIPRQGIASSVLPPTSTGYSNNSNRNLDLIASLPGSSIELNENNNNADTIYSDQPIVLGIDDIDRFRSERERQVYKVVI